MATFAGTLFFAKRTFKKILQLIPVVMIKMNIDGDYELRCVECTSSGNDVVCDCYEILNNQPVFLSKWSTFSIIF